MRGLGRKSCHYFQSKNRTASVLCPWLLFHILGETGMSLPCTAGLGTVSRDFSEHMAFEKLRLWERTTARALMETRGERGDGSGSTHTWRPCEVAFSERGLEMAGWERGQDQEESRLSPSPSLSSGGLGGPSRV